MNRFFVVLLLLVVGVLGLAFGLGWFHLSRDHTDRKTNFTITVDQDKIQEDREKAKETMQDLGQKVKEKVGTATDKGKEEAPRR